MSREVTCIYLYTFTRTLQIAPFNGIIIVPYAQFDAVGIVVQKSESAGMNTVSNWQGGECSLRSRSQVRTGGFSPLPLFKRQGGGHVERHTIVASIYQRPHLRRR